MKVQINFANFDSTDALTAQVTGAVESTLSRFADRITRVEVHLHDDKQKRHGPDDKRCTMEARPAGDKPLAVEARARDMYDAVKECAGKLYRALEHRFDRADEVR